MYQLARPLPAYANLMEYDERAARNLRMPPTVNLERDAGGEERTVDEHMALPQLCSDRRHQLPSFICRARWKRSDTTHGSKMLPNRLRDQALAAESSEFDYKFEPGKYYVEAQLTGIGASNPNLDVAGIGFMPYWESTVVSNRLQFEVPK